MSIEYLAIGLLALIVVLLVIAILKLHQLPAVLGLAKSGASTVVADIEAVIAKHKAATPAATPPASGQGSAAVISSPNIAPPVAN